MNVSLTKEEADNLRRKKVVMSYHSATRWMNRLNFKKIEDVIQEGEIRKEGKNKYRAVMPIKGQKVAYVIFINIEDCIYVKTVGIARR